MEIVNLPRYETFVLPHYQVPGPVQRTTPEMVKLRIQKLQQTNENGLKPRVEMVANLVLRLSPDKP